jgi:hypothetical protein
MDQAALTRIVKLEERMTALENKIQYLADAHKPEPIPDAKPSPTK